eukprot:1184254-Prorocentrum_minimum.AAC.5
MVVTWRPPGNGGRHVTFRSEGGSREDLGTHLFAVPTDQAAQQVDVGGVEGDAELSTQKVHPRRVLLHQPGQHRVQVQRTSRRVLLLQRPVPLRHAWPDRNKIKQIQQESKL